jgi:hypothetical protein
MENEKTPEQLEREFAAAFPQVTSEIMLDAVADNYARGRGRGSEATGGEVMNSVRIPRPIRKAVKMALATPDENEGLRACTACSNPYDMGPGSDPTACCNSCAQMLLTMLASYVECLRTGRKYERVVAKVLANCHLDEVLPEVK